MRGYTWHHFGPTLVSEVVIFSHSLPALSYSVASCGVGGHFSIGGRENDALTQRNGRRRATGVVLAPRWRVQRFRAPTRHRRTTL